jgi:hypothetical protein
LPQQLAQRQSGIECYVRVGTIEPERDLPAI